MRFAKNTCRARGRWTSSSSRCCRAADRGLRIEPGGGRHRRPGPAPRFRDDRLRARGRARRVRRARPADRRLRAAGLRRGPGYIVVSTQSRGDEAALQAALSVETDYVAFVGSKKKAATLKKKLAIRASRGATRPAEGAGRPRPRRHHAGGDRAVDPRRDCGRAARQTTERHARDTSAVSLTARGHAQVGRTRPPICAFMTQLFHPWWRRRTSILLPPGGGTSRLAAILYPQPSRGRG